MNGESELDREGLDDPAYLEGPFFYVAMPINDRGQGPEMDPAKVQWAQHEVWNAHNLSVATAHDETVARRIANALNVAPDGVSTERLRGLLTEARAPMADPEVMTLEPVGEPTTLARCPVGLFLANDSLCLKTEYGNNDGRIDAYIVDSGEFFWGAAPQTIASQRAQIVHPLARRTLSPGGSGEVVAWRTDIFEKLPNGKLSRLILEADEVKEPGEDWTPLYALSPSSPAVRDGVVEALREAERFMAYFAGETDNTFEGPGTPKTCLATIRRALSNTKETGE